MARKRDQEIIDALHKLSKNNPKLVRSSTYSAPADSAVIVRSWKMNEFKYYDVPSPFPTLARGLFTRRISGGEEDGSSAARDSIVARGYDKFFNIGEVPWTTWQALETHTTAPYFLTMKSNGCIIFIAPLTESKLVITSKHSLGSIAGQSTSHAQAGEGWLRRHLEKAGKTEEQLAKTLWDKGWTAVAELCDDNFEEHVLPITPEMTGLHLHGINRNTGDFETRDPPEVTEFAREWGFIPTEYTTLNTVKEVREFTQEVSKSGAWKGQPIEGFVVRTRIAMTPSPPPAVSDVPDVSNVTSERGGRRNRSSDRDDPPYPPGASFFFKVKFDEPYMMYRDWREITKMLLSTKVGDKPKIPKSKLNRPETRLYKEWVEKEIANNRAAFDGYTHNKGIIATRERFLKWRETRELPGQDEKQSSQDGNKLDEEKNDKPRRAVIVPVAIPGCGKTTIAVALQHLFGFGHTQSDDVKAKRPAPVFLQNVVNLLRKHDVVIADKNNHMVQHRHGLRTATVAMIPPVRLIALNWALEKPPAIIHRICSDRIQARGENHQTLRADERKVHEDVLWTFMDQGEELMEGEVDYVIEMDVAESVEDGLARVVNGLVDILGLERPSDERIGEALRVAMTYKPSGPKQDRARKEAEAMQGKKDPAKKFSPGRPPRYYALLPEMDVNAIVDAQLAAPDAPESAKSFWAHLQEQGRVSSRPHVTLVHCKNRPTEEAMWDKCGTIFRLALPPTFSFELGHLVWDDRVMAITVENLTVSRGDEGEIDAGTQFLDEMPGDVQRRLHITVGTRHKDINAVEAKGLVESWRDGAEVAAVPMKKMQVKGRLKGLQV